MPVNTERREIPYFEYRVIADLLRAHVEQYGDRLKGMVVFGDLLTQWDAFDIELLEIIEGWEDNHFGEFAELPNLPMRGRLRLYFLTPEEFENPTSIQDSKERMWVEELLDRVREGYEIVTESPWGWVRQVLDRGRYPSTFTAPPSGSVGFKDPLNLPKKG
jgi:hypothetical protein